MYFLLDVCNDKVLASQDVAGTNYAILCRDDEPNEDLWSVVYLYHGVDGTDSIINIARLDRGNL